MTDVIDAATLLMRRWFAATPPQVFDAWTEKANFEAWIGPPGVRCAVDVFEPRVGGRYAVQMTLSTGEAMPVGGVFREVERPGRLVMTWGWNGDPTRQSLMTLTFAAKDGGTEMVLRQEGLGSIENRDGHQKGWAGAFGKLEAFLSRNPPV